MLSSSPCPSTPFASRGPWGKNPCKPGVIYIAYEGRNGRLPIDKYLREFMPPEKRFFKDFDLLLPLLINRFEIVKVMPAGLLLIDQL